MFLLFNRSYDIDNKVTDKLLYLLLAVNVINFLFDLTNNDIDLILPFIIIIKYVIDNSKYELNIK
jgi:hypothetical protein